MKEYFKDKRGWLATAIFILTVVATGMTKTLNRHTNPAIIMMFFVAMIIVYILNSGKPDENNIKKLEENKNETFNNDADCRISGD